MLDTLRAGYLFFNKNQKDNENGIINQRRYFIKSPHMQRPLLLVDMLMDCKLENKRW